MLEHGIVAGGVVLPGTEWVFRDASAWWSGGIGTRPRADTVDVLVGHWTAGPPRIAPEAGPAVVRAMKARKNRKTGRRLNVGIHFVIGWDGTVWQTADLATATVHTGCGALNARSVGVETCWPGTRSLAKRLGYEGPFGIGTVGRCVVDVVAPSSGILASWVALAETLATAELGEDRHGIRLRLPRRVPRGTQRFTPAEQREWAGGQEHLHVPGSRKIDAAGLLVGALAQQGWERA